MALRRHYVLIPSIAALHLAASVALLLTSAGASLDRLETGSSPPLLERISSAVGNVLLYPVFIPFSGVLGMSSGVIGWMLLILNSLVWAAAVKYLLQIATAHRRRAAARRPQSAGGAPGAIMSRIKNPRHSPLPE
jgi:hypothetical protein